MCGIALYAPNDLVWSWEHPANPLVINTPKTLGDFVGGTLAERPEPYKQASPLNLVTAQTPPTFLIHGQRDELVFHKQSERMAARLREEGVMHLFVSLPWATHGLDANPAGPGGQIYLWTLERFLARVTSG